jgi:hypothetical protein
MESCGKEVTVQVTDDRVIGGYWSGVCGYCYDIMVLANLTRLVLGILYMKLAIPTMQSNLLSHNFMFLLPT